MNRDRWEGIRLIPGLTALEVEETAKGVATPEKDSISFAAFALGLVWNW